VTAAIEVLAIRPLDGKGTVKAFVDVRLGGVTIKGRKIVSSRASAPGASAVSTSRSWPRGSSRTRSRDFEPAAPRPADPRAARRR
jgi:hypothetical protein